VNHAGDILGQRHLTAAPAPFLNAVAPSRDGRVVAGAGLFTGYWLAELCAPEGSPCGLGHALYRTAMPGGKATNATRDAPQMAALLRGGLLPQASVSPAERRATRALWRRRTHRMRQRAARLAHVPKTPSPYHLPAIGQKIADQTTREGMAERVAAPAVHTRGAVDLALSTSDDHRRGPRALSMVQAATHPDANPL
jgi:hypothetical protein